MSKVLTSNEFEKELEKLNEIEKNRITVEFDKTADVDDILATLKSVDEIKLMWAQKRENSARTNKKLRNDISCILSNTPFSSRKVPP